MMQTSINQVQISFAYFVKYRQIIGKIMQCITKCAVRQIPNSSQSLLPRSTKLTDFAII